MVKILRIMLCGIILAAPLSAAALKKDSTETAAGGGGGTYRIDKPGTITFMVGVKIKGKVEKPQVMIFLPKEKPYYKKATFSYSFMDDMMKPLPFTPVEK